MDEGPLLVSPIPASSNLHRWKAAYEVRDVLPRPVARDQEPEQAYQEVLEQVQYAEELGFESVWLAEHHFTRYGLAPSPLMLGAYLAARTSRIRIGPPSSSSRCTTW